MKKDCIEKEESTKYIKPSYCNPYFVDLLKDKICSKEQLLAEYVNKLFEQEERWIMVNWIVHNINSAMEILPLSEFVCQEIQKIANPELCAILLWDKTNRFFQVVFDKSITPNNEIEALFKTDLKRYTTYINTTINNQAKNIYEKIENYIKESGITKYVLPIITDSGFIAIIYLYKSSPLYNDVNVNVIDIICDNYKQSM